MKNFTIIPNELLNSSQLTIMERYLYCVLLKLCGNKDYCFPSQKTIATTMGKSPRYVWTLLDKLEKKGFIKRTRRGWNRSNTYEVAKKLLTNSHHSANQISNMFPFHHSNVVPANNTYVNKQAKRSVKGFISFRDSLIEKGIIKLSPLDYIPDEE